MLDAVSAAAADTQALAQGVAAAARAGSLTGEEREARERELRAALKVRPFYVGFFSGFSVSSRRFPCFFMLCFVFGSCTRPSQGVRVCYIPAAYHSVCGMYVDTGRVGS